ncbi:MAG: MFS transporter [Anaerolineae bacterium]|jgi:UMF1 family MFS transporter
METILKAIFPNIGRQSTRSRLAWYSYDIGNSAYAAVVLLAVYAAYFKEHVVGGAEGSRLWGLSVGIAMLVVAVISPVLGVIADFAGRKKRFLLFFTALACLATATLFFVRQGDILAGMLLFILAEIGYRGGQVFYNALLPEVAEREETGRVSGNGWAIGLIGGIGCLLLVLVLITAVEGTWVVRLSLVFTALYFAVFATPLFVWLRERAQHQPMPERESYIGVALKRLQRTFGTVRQHREFIKFIIAFLVYNDGVLMTINFAAIFGAVMFGLEQQMLLVFMIIVQVTSVVGAYFSGILTEHIGNKNTLIVFILMMLAAVLGLFLNESVLGFFIIGGVAGCALSAVQSVSRGMIAVLSPPGRSAEFYGFFAVAGRTSSFIGPTIYGIVAAEAALWFQAQGESASFLWFRAHERGAGLAEQLGQRVAILPVLAFLAVGLVLLLSVQETSRRSGSARKAA